MLMKKKKGVSTYEYSIALILMAIVVVLIIIALIAPGKFDFLRNLPGFKWILPEEKDLVEKACEGYLKDLSKKSFTLAFEGLVSYDIGGDVGYVDFWKRGACCVEVSHKPGNAEWVWSKENQKGCGSVNFENIYLSYLKSGNYKWEVKGKIRDGGFVFWIKSEGESDCGNPIGDYSTPEGGKVEVIEGEKCAEIYNEKIEQELIERQIY